MTRRQDPFRDEEIRQLLEATNARRAAHGRPPLDLTALGGGSRRRAAGRDPGLRRVPQRTPDRPWEPPLDVEAEVERRLRLGRGDAVGDRGRLTAIGCVQLAQDVRDVDAGRLDADHERRRRSRGWCSPRATRVSTSASRGVRPRTSSSRVWAIRCGLRSGEVEPRPLGEKLELAQQRRAPSRAATACACPQRRARLGAGRTGGDQRLRLRATGSRQRGAGAATGPRRRRRCDQGSGRAAPRTRSYSASASARQAAALGVIGRASAAARRALGEQLPLARSSAVSTRRRRPGGRGRAPPAPPAPAALWCTARRGSAPRPGPCTCEAVARGLRRRPIHRRCQRASSAT